MYKVFDSVNKNRRRTVFRDHSRAPNDDGRQWGSSVQSEACYTESNDKLVEDQWIKEPRGGNKQQKKKKEEKRKEERMKKKTSGCK